MKKGRRRELRRRPPWTTPPSGLILEHRPRPRQSPGQGAEARGGDDEEQRQVELKKFIGLKRVIGLKNMTGRATSKDG